MSDKTPEEILGECMSDSLFEKHRIEIIEAMQAYADQELASLREQLKEKQQQLDAVLRNSTKLMDQLKQKEDENRELIAMLDNVLSDVTDEDLGGVNSWTIDQIKSLIQKHTKNLSA